MRQAIVVSILLLVIVGAIVGIIYFQDKGVLGFQSSTTTTYGPECYHVNVIFQNGTVIVFQTIIPGNDSYYYLGTGNPTISLC